jgi:hypothetical protein
MALASRYNFHLVQKLMRSRFSFTKSCSNKDDTFINRSKSKQIVATRNVYRVSQEECARLRENVPCVKLRRHNPKHLCPKLNCYGDNGQRKVWSSCGFTYCTCLADALPVHCACPSLRVECSLCCDCHVICLET